CAWTCRRRNRGEIHLAHGEPCPRRNGGEIDLTHRRGKIDRRVTSGGSEPRRNGGEIDLLGCHHARHRRQVGGQIHLGAGPAEVELFPEASEILTRRWQREIPELSRAGIGGGSRGQLRLLEAGRERRRRRRQIDLHLVRRRYGDQLLGGQVD